MEERGNDFSRDNFIELSGMTHAGSQISRALEESEEEIIKKRKEKVSSLFKKGNLIYYLLLGVIVMQMQNFVPRIDSYGLSTEQEEFFNMGFCRSDCNFCCLSGKRQLRSCGNLNLIIN